MSTSNHIHLTEEAFEALYALHWKALYQYSYAYVKDADLAKDLVQEIFISLWEKRHKQAIRESFKKYLFSALKLKIFEHYRKLAVKERYVQHTSHQPPVNTDNTEDQVDYNELIKTLQAVVKSLPPQSQLVYKMRKEENMSNKHIAASLSIQEKAVEANMTRALYTIKKRLRALMENDNG